MEITFKDVGQGDSIVLEWTDNGQKKIGIVDSAIYQFRNPILEHLRATLPKEIEFIFLSHLHHDHFSGFSDVLDFCYTAKISIKQFYYTFSGETVQVFSKDNKTKKARDMELFLLTFDKYFKDGPNKIILDGGHITTKSLPIVRLNDDIMIHILAPTEYDCLSLEVAIGKYIGKRVTTDPDINSVSTILKISRGDEYVLLTADAPKSHISRNTKRLFSDTMVICQVPHHGSKYNHPMPFWQNAKRTEQSVAIFSCGIEKKDEIPDDITVQEIHSLKYKIHSTNQVYGIATVFGDIPNVPEDPIIQDLEDLLDEDEPTIMSPVLNTLNGDQKFNIW